MSINFWGKISKPVVALAPMAGVADSIFRRICREYGADVTYSEMASVSALFFNPQKTLEMLKFDKKERPYVIQLFGSNPAHFAKAARIVTKKLRPDGIDINFGCPAKKVFKTGAGCALMQDFKLSRKIVETVLENTFLPVSIKIRSGIKGVNAKKFINYISDLPISAVMVHCRTYEEGFSGVADFQVAADVKNKMPKTIVLANGGIYTPEDALNIIQKYPEIDGLGIARGALGKPFIFAQIKELMQNGAYKKYDWKEIKKIVIEHARLAYKAKKEAGMVEMRKHLAWYVKGFPGASELRKKLVKVENLKEIKDILGAQALDKKCGV